MHNLMKKFLLILAFVVSALVAKELAVFRAAGFYTECLSPEELELVRSREAHKLSEKSLATFVENKLSCIEEKQTVFERIAFRVMGKYLYYPVFF
jgi:hypothetical protein